jgi:transcriptional regulator with XRE-family HTH domain
MTTDGESSFFSGVIREARAARKLSQEELAKLCGVFQPTIARWERGAPIEASLRKVAEALGLTLEALLYPSVAAGYREFNRRRRRKKVPRAQRSS